MVQKGIVIKNNSKIVYKAGFSGDIVTGIAQFKFKIEALNPTVTFTYDEYESEDQIYLDAIVDEVESATLNW